MMVLKRGDWRPDVPVMRTSTVDFHFAYCTMHTNSAAVYSVVMIYAQSRLGLLTISPTTRCAAHAHQGRTPAQARHPAKDARHMVILIFYRCPFISSIH